MINFLICSPSYLVSDCKKSRLVNPIDGYNLGSLLIGSSRNFIFGIADFNIGRDTPGRDLVHRPDDDVLQIIGKLIYRC